MGGAAGVRVRRQGGFTLIELMVVVAIIAILAAIVVPMFTREANEATADAEVTAMFAELGTKEQAYRLENGAYLSTGAAESDTWPVSPNQQEQAVFPIPASWTTLKVVPPESRLKCGYVVQAGAAGAPGGAVAVASFSFTSPSQDWYYVLAHCNLDGDSSTDGYYFQSSVDMTLRKINPSF